MKKAALVLLLLLAMALPCAAQYSGEFLGAVAASGSLYKFYYNVQTSIPGGSTFTRGSSGTYFDNTGTLQTATTNTARFDFYPPISATSYFLYEPASTNYAANGNATGTGSNACGSGFMPTGWGFGGGSTAGLTCSIIGQGTEDGIGYVDVNFTGTTTGTSFTINTSANTTASASQVWVTSAYVKLVGGSLTNVTGVQEQMSVVGGSGTNNGTIVLPTSAALSTQRYSATGTVGTGTTAVRGAILITLNNTAAVNMTLRMGGSQFELGSVPSSYVVTTGTTASRSADSLTFTVPAGVGHVKYGFYDGTSQTVTASPGSYTVPTTLNESHIKFIGGTS